MIAIAIGAAAAVISAGSIRYGGAVPAGASLPTALQIADHGLLTVVGPDDEGTYALIDPIGPGGVKSVEAADEVYASTLQGGIYRPWQPYRDPFAPQPSGPAAGGPYTPPNLSEYGGGQR